MKNSGLRLTPELELLRRVQRIRARADVVIHHIEKIVSDVDHSRPEHAVEPRPDPQRKPRRSNAGGSESR